ncbi:MAG: nucleotidyltransferase domain-containing protein, partial [Epsilonproteobacteria bacterium]|nr:nucleotidyltransferase domain-containing protein [Campylobacterota bacterium]
MLVRLRKKEIETIKKLIFEYLGECEIYIFGSRTDLSKKGGDIDIYVIPKKQPEFRKTLILKTKLED